jgi:hypothetical protein
VKSGNIINLEQVRSRTFSTLPPPPKARTRTHKNKASSYEISPTAQLASYILMTTSNTCNLCFSFVASDYISQAYKTNGKIIVLYILIFSLWKVDEIVILYIMYYFLSLKPRMIPIMLLYVFFAAEFPHTKS